MTKTPFSMFFSALVLGAAGTAGAQEGGPTGANDFLGALRLDASFYHDDEDGTVFAPSFEARYRAGQRFAFSGGMTMAVLHGDTTFNLFDENDGKKQTELAPGAVYILGDYLLKDGSLRGSIGVELGTSLLHTDNIEFGDLAALSGGIATRGMWNMWRFLPNTVSAGGHVHFVWSEGPLRAGLEGAATALIPTRDNFFDDDAELLVQGGLDGAFDAGIFAAGLRFRGVANATGDDDCDCAQLSLEPYVEADFDKSFFETALTINLDEPLGFAFDEDGIWGVRATVGARF